MSGNGALDMIVAAGGKLLYAEANACLTDCSGEGICRSNDEGDFRCSCLMGQYRDSASLGVREAGTREG